MPRLLLTAVIALLAACTTTAPAKATGPMADLRVLESQGAWQELVQRIGAVPPAERDDEWQRIAASGAGKYLESFEPKADRTAERAVEEADALLKQYPTLGRSKEFMAARLAAGKRAFLFSFSNYRHSGYGDEWIARILAFAKADAVTPGIAETLAKEVVLERLIPITAFPFFQLELEKTGAATCTSETWKPVFRAVVEDTSWFNELKALLNGQCKAAAPALQAEVEAAPASSDLRKNGCALFPEARACKG